jgi:hypothetical protein
MARETKWSSASFSASRPGGLSGKVGTGFPVRQADQINNSPPLGAVSGSPSGARTKKSELGVREKEDAVRPAKQKKTRREPGLFKNQTLR